MNANFWHEVGTSKTTMLAACFRISLLPSDNKLSNDNELLRDIYDCIQYPRRQVRRAHQGKIAWIKLLRQQRSAQRCVQRQDNL